MADTRTPQNGQNETADDAQERTDDWRGSLRRSWYAMSDLLSPFSPSALAALPKKTFRTRPRYIRNDNVPEAQQDESGQMPTVRDYHSINDLPPQVRVPKKIATPIKVEGKVWFANERSALFSFCVHSWVSNYWHAAWIAYLNISVLIGTLSLALFNASKDQIARNFAYAYAAISVGILVRVILTISSNMR